MKVLNDQWTPLFISLKSKISPTARKQLLFQLIGELQDISMLNFGSTGLNRPATWAELTEHYAAEKKKGNRTPDLILTGEMLQSFVHEISENSASLTNIAPYSDSHQFGETYKNLPARPFYPVTADGLELTEFAKGKLLEIVENHFK